MTAATIPNRIAGRWYNDAPMPLLSGDAGRAAVRGRA